MQNYQANTKKIFTKFFWSCDPAGLLQESLGPFGPEVSPECPRECPRKWGVSEGVSDGVSSGPLGPRAPECPSKKCPQSVPGVSKRCPDTPGTHSGTLQGHFGPEGPERLLT